jgi:hypothetical protein
MNDPHVKALHYLVVCGQSADYDNAPPLQEETTEFTLSIGGKHAVFEIKNHYASVEEARRRVEEYIRAWEMLAGIEHDPGNFRLVFERPEVIDRSPSPNSGNVLSLTAHISSHVHVSDQVTVHISRHKFPEPPKEFVASPDAETMYLRYKAYRESRESLTAMAYMCLTVVVATAGGRTKAAKRYFIDEKVLITIGRLSSVKGSPQEARKFPKRGSFDPLVPEERQWLIEATKALIRRVGEREANRATPLKRIKMNDLPPITGAGP